MTHQLDRVVVSFLLLALVIAGTCGAAEQPERIYLSGKDVAEPAQWEFKVTAGMQADKWTTIPVPSCWELQGFGCYSYGKDKEQCEEKGLYKHLFTVPEDWQGRRILIVFEGVMTDAEVKVNGEPAGPVHQGAFYPFRYEITKLVKYGGPSLLEVTVSKESSNESVNRAERRGDYWNFGGIFRPVYLQAHPEQFIDRVAIDARADGRFEMEVAVNGRGRGDTVRAEITNAEGKVVSDVFEAGLNPAGRAVLQTEVNQPAQWTSETPNLYTVSASLLAGDETLHETSERFGFRTVEVKTGDGIYINGRKVLLKGVNRHTFHPDTGRATSRKLSFADAELIKQMNMNAVRMSHYPPDEHFLDACDELGLFVFDELAGWHQAYDTKVGTELVEAMVVRDRNHPCIIMWDNGNEGGWNTELDGLFAKFDPQGRTVIHPWESFNGVNTGHYPTYNALQDRLTGGDIVVPTEFLHGLYDGGHGAALADYWKLMRSSPKAAGGFLWVFCDESVKRTDQDGRLDSRGNLAPDGVVGPYREKEGSFFAIKEIWSAVQIDPVQLNESFDGTLRVENRYGFTDLASCSFGWELWDFPAPDRTRAGHTVTASAQIEPPSVAPGSSAQIKLNLPSNWQKSDALHLWAKSPAGRLLRTWTWPIASTKDYMKEIVTSDDRPVRARVEDGLIKVSAGELTIAFDATNALLKEVEYAGAVVPLGNGPVVIAGNGVNEPNNLLQSQCSSLEHKTYDNNYVISATFDGPMKHLEWRIDGSGWVRLEYEYELEGVFDYFGVGFDYPAKAAKAFKWLGGGPYRVWKNRLAGAGLDVWRKDYNEAVTGVVCEYPEFKGYHAGVRWALLETTEQPILIVLENEPVFVHLFTPTRPQNPRNAEMIFPPTDLSLLSAIAPIGTKFHGPDELGPQSAKNKTGGSYSQAVYFHFGATK